MTDPIATPDETNDPINEVEVDSTPTVEPEPAQEESGNKEAAKYRRQLRDSETERGALASQVENLQRQQIATLAASSQMYKPEAIFATGRPIADFLNEDGDIDPVKVNEIAEEVIETLGLSRRPRPLLGQGPRPEMAKEERKTWDQFLKSS